MNTLDEYMSIYGMNYSENARNAIYELFDTDIPVDIVLQIKSKLNLIPEDKDIYKKFIEKLDEHSMLHGKVLEVSCGYYPALAEAIIKTHDVELTSVDPNLVTTKTHGISLIKGMFPDDVDVNSFDSIISLLPCEATIPIIKESRKYNKPYLLVLCKCTHFDNINPFMPVSYGIWEDYVIHKAYEYKEEKDSIIEEELERENGDTMLVLGKKQL